MTQIRSILIGIVLLALPAGAHAQGITVAEHRASQFTVGTVSAHEAFASSEAAFYIILALLIIVAAAVFTTLALTTGVQTESALTRVEQQLPNEEV